MSSDVIPLGRPERDYHTSLDDLIDELQNMLSNRIGVQMERAIIHTSGTWVAPNNLSGGRVRVRMVGGGSSGDRVPSGAGLSNLANDGRRGGYVEVWGDVVGGHWCAGSVVAGGVGWGCGWWVADRRGIEFPAVRVSAILQIMGVEEGTSRFGQTW